MSQNDLDKLKHTRALENNSAHDCIPLACLIASPKSSIESESNSNDCLSFFESKSSWRKRYTGDHKEQNQMSVQMFWIILVLYMFKYVLKKCKTISISISSISSRRCHAFPSILVRGHGRVGPAHPQPPWPRGAVGQPRHGR